MLKAVIWVIHAARKQSRRFTESNLHWRKNAAVGSGSQIVVMNLCCNHCDHQLHQQKCKAQRRNEDSRGRDPSAAFSVSFTKRCK